MINIWIALRNPFRCKAFRPLWAIQKPLTKNKTFEMQISHYAFNWLELQLDLNWRQTDHAGPWLMINVFGYTIDIRLYDNRSWNDSTNSWR